jgi:hypothetical protein
MHHAMRVISTETRCEEEQLFRDLWEDGTQREVVIESLQADCEVRYGKAESPLYYEGEGGSLFFSYRALSNMPISSMLRA